MSKFFWLFLLAFGLSVPRAAAEYFTIINYHVAVVFFSEGHADFEELIEVEFTMPRHGIFRQVPNKELTKLTGEHPPDS